MSKDNHRRIEMNLKMLSKVGIIAFTVSPKPMALWKLFVGSVGGAVLAGIFIPGVLCLFRYLFMRKVDKN
jgi:hypothetical protein